MSQLYKFPIIESDNVNIILPNIYNYFDNTKKTIILTPEILQLEEDISEIIFNRYTNKLGGQIDIRGIVSIDKYNFCFNFILNREFLIEELKERLSVINSKNIDFKKVDILLDDYIISNYVKLSNLKNYIKFINLFDSDEFLYFINKNSIFNKNLNLTKLDFQITYNIKNNKLQFRNNKNLIKVIDLIKMDFIKRRPFCNIRGETEFKFKILCYMLYKFGGETRIIEFQDQLEKQLIL